MKNKYVLMLVGVALAVLGTAQSALADAAPPPSPPSAGSVETGGSRTKVQMESENVIMTIADDIAYVKATFNMRNQGTEEEALDVRFPVDAYTGHNLDDSTTISVYNFAAYVDGEPAEVAYVQYPESASEGPFLHWATWHVIFPPGQGIALGVIYQVDPYGSGPQRYSYILNTGAGWSGPIGEGTITVRLPYEISQWNVLHIQPDYAEVSGTDIIWHFTDLEPTDRDDISVDILSPPTWRAIQAARQEVDENPDSADAHFKLARALNKEMGGWNIRAVDPYFPTEGQILAKMIEEYQRGMELEPSDVAIYIEYIDVLLGHYAAPEDIALVVESGLAVDPGNERLLELQKEVNNRITPSPIWTPTLTQAPSPTLAQHKSPVQETPTLAALPTSTPIPTSLPNPSPPIGLWVAIGAVVISGAVIGVGVYRRKASRE